VWGDDNKNQSREYVIIAMISKLSDFKENINLRWKKPTQDLEGAKHQTRRNEERSPVWQIVVNELVKIPNDNTDEWGEVKWRKWQRWFGIGKWKARHWSYSSQREFYKQERLTMECHQNMKWI
jgi:hypothetical protein